MVTIKIEYPTLVFRTLTLVVAESRAEQIMAMNQEERLDFLRSELDKERPHPEPFGPSPAIRIERLGL